MSSSLRRVARAGLVSLAVAIPAVSAFAATSASADDPNDVNIVINEIETNGGLPDDWVELYNTGAVAVDLTGYIFRDNSATTATLPSGTIVPANGYLVLNNSGPGALFTVGLGAADSARLFKPNGTTLIDTYSWTAHPVTTWGRCANGVGAFVAQPYDANNPTSSATKGAANDCSGGPTAPPPTIGITWPGGPTVATASTFAFGQNMSGLIYEPSGSSAKGTLWAARNGVGSIFKLVYNTGTSTWVPDTTNSWGAGKAVKYTNGLGELDAEGITFGPTGSSSGIYIASERNNSANGVSRNSVLRFDPAVAGTTLTALQEWDLTADLLPTGANLGLEGITFIPDSFLTSKNFFDDSSNATYNPANYPLHGSGLFFVAVEQNGKIYAYALNSDGSFNRVASFSSGFSRVMDVQFDRELGEMWAACDDTCNGQINLMRVDPGTGKFGVAFTFDRPAGVNPGAVGSMPNINNEGFAFAPIAECDNNNQRPAFWSDDNNTGGVAIRSGTIPCLGLQGGAVVPQMSAVLLALGLGGIALAGLTMSRRRQRGSFSLA
jgi:Lamin Tail Domain